MKYDHDKHHRHSIRLKDYDYGQQGAYCVTICTHNREFYFETPDVADAATKCWLAIPQHFPVVELDEWVLMPNHLHGILVINDDSEQGSRRGVQLNAPTSPRDSSDKFSAMSPHRNTLGVIVRTYKAAVTTECHKRGHTEFAWQRNYHERIVRDERHLNRVRQYVVNNPAKWAEDMYNPANPIGRDDL